MTAATQILSSPAFRNGCDRVDAACRAFLSKAGAGKRFNREKAGKPFFVAHRELALEGVAALWAHLEQTGGFDRIERHAALKTKALAKALDEADIALIQELLAAFGWPLERLPEIAAKLTAENLPVIYEAAASFALGRLGADSFDFTLSNPAIRESLLARSAEAIFAQRRGIEEAMKTIVRQFVERGAIPHDPDFLAALREDLEEDSTWKARRFAVTETGIAAESANHEVYARSGVEKKVWRTFEDELVRDSHEALDGKAIPMAEQWDVGGNPAKHPMDPALPANELVHCRCWEEPDLDGKPIAESAMWRGE